MLRAEKAAHLSAIATCLRGLTSKPSDHHDDSFDAPQIQLVDTVARFAAICGFEVVPRDEDHTAWRT